MKKPTISVVGLGKLGLPILNVFKSKFDVIGIDKEKKEGFTTSFKKLGDVTFIVVPTPSLPNYKFTSDYVEDVLLQIKRKQIVVIVSTLMPGETDRLQKKYKKLDLVYSPTFVALGTVALDFTHPDIIIFGTTKYETAEFLYENIYKKVIETDPYVDVLFPLEAEIAKLSLNCYVTTKITFANQIGNLCHRIGARPDRVLNLIGHDGRVGTSYFKSGLGYGGPCFPRDNLAMSAYMIDNGYDPAMNRTTHQLNKRQIYEIVERICERHPASVGFSGLSYKEGTEVMDESQLKDIHDILVSRGYKTIIGGKGDVNLDWRGICEQS